MAIFIGHIILASIRNQKRYEQALYEILQYLKTHEHDVTIKFDSNYIMFSSKDTGYDSVNIPFHVNYLKTCYFRIYHGVEVRESAKVFGTIAWEILNILKEHFPSKIHLFQENLDLCEPIYKPLSLKEEIRRQISCLEARKQTEALFK
jgi:hypothetical protein